MLPGVRGWGAPMSRSLWMLAGAMFMGVAVLGLVDIVAEVYRSLMRRK